MDIFKTFATDAKLEIEGRWIEFDGETSFKIARAYNKNHSRLFQKEYKLNKVLLESKTPAAEEKLEKIYIECMAKAVLVDWKGSVELNGEDLGKYSVENAIKILKLKDFREWVEEQAKDLANYKACQDSEDEKN